MKKILKGIAIIAMISAISLSLVGCGDEGKSTNEQLQENVNISKEQEVGTAGSNIPAEDKSSDINLSKSDEVGTAGSNIPLKDNFPEAEYQVRKAFQNYLVENYKEKIFDVRVKDVKLYSVEEEQETDALKERNLGPNEIAFEVHYEIKPSKGTDVNEFTAANGEYDEESGWIIEKYNLGILRPSNEEEGQYIVTDLGTGW